jgi:hypothetical protein
VAHEGAPGKREKNRGCRSAQELLFIGTRSAAGGGLYVSHAGTVKRVWCLASTHNGEPCALARLEVSPDGCQIAFVERSGYTKTVKIIHLCSSVREK